MTRSPILAFGDDGSPGADIAWLAINNHRWPEWHLKVISAHMVETLGPPLPPEETYLHEWNPPQPRHAFAEAEFAEVKHLTARSDPRIVLMVDCDLLVIGPRWPGTPQVPPSRKHRRLAPKPSSGTIAYCPPWSSDEIGGRLRGRLPSCRQGHRRFDSSAMDWPTQRHRIVHRRRPDRRRGRDTRGSPAPRSSRCDGRGTCSQRQTHTRNSRSPRTSVTRPCCSRHPWPDRSPTPPRWIDGERCRPNRTMFRAGCVR